MNRGDFASLFGWVAAIFPLSQEGSQVDLGLLILLVESRWTGCDAERIHQYAPELVALAPDVILAPTNSHVWPLRQIIRTIPIVFVQVAGLSGGSVASIASTADNATGFTSFEFGLSAKWLELLKQIAPRTTRVAVLRVRAGPRRAPDPFHIRADIEPINFR